MALNMSDPGVVMAVYSSIVDNDLNWLLLHYVNDSSDELGMHSSGRKGLEEMKMKIIDLDQVYIAFYREEVGADPGYLIINYIPTSVSGVRRAKALVHSRRVGAIFKIHQSIFTVDSLSLITTNNIHQAIANPDTTFSPSLIHLTQSQAGDTSQPEQPDDRRTSPLHSAPELLRILQPVRSQTSPPSRPVEQDMVRRSFTSIRDTASKPPSPPPKGGSGLFSNFLRRKKKGSGDSGPPPPPPKEGHALPMGLSYSQPSPSTGYLERPVRHKRSHSFSDFALISRALDSEELVLVEAQKEPPPLPRKEASTVQYHTLPAKGKWSHEIAHPNDPIARAQRRRELQLQKEKDEREALEAEARRQERIKRKKEEILRQEIEDEKKRKAETEEEIRRITAERKRKEQFEREEEERKTRELEERKRLARDRRLEEHRRLEHWRIEQSKKEQEAARQLQMARRQEEAERKNKIQLAEAKVKKPKGESDLTGWVTVLGSDSLSWKRRFYKFTVNSVSFYRDSSDLVIPLEKVDLKGKLRGLKEWNDGYEDLEAIAFSFVVEFKDNRPCWSMYADSDADKYKILGLFKLAGGL